MDEPQYGPFERAGALYGLSRSTLYRMAAEGRITLRKIGSRTLVDLASLRAAIEAAPIPAIKSDRPAA